MRVVMTAGMVFDIREFAIHDGPGIRTTVFLKGCPLRCSWCHNPEGQSSVPQVISGGGADRIAGAEYTAQALANLLNRQAAVLMANEGGVTFSGGEPLQQAGFVAEVIDRLEEIHVLLDTSGYGSESALNLLLERVDMVFFDLKLIDREAHRRFTGCDNDSILRNLAILGKSGVPFVVRVPLIPGVTDTDNNLAAIAGTVRGLTDLLRVDLLPYNKAAGGKYRAAGMEFKPGFDELQPLNINTGIFKGANLEAHVL